MYKNLLLLCAILFAIQANAQVDTTIGRTAPANVSKDYQTLTQYLCGGLTSDKQKANAIYNWVTCNIDYDLKEEKNPNKDIPEAEDVIKRKKSIMMGYNNLFVAMCKEAGLRAVIIPGYYRSHLLHNDSDDIHIAKSAWCGVQINDEWYIVDPISGAGIVTYKPGWLRSLINSITNKEDVKHAKKQKFVSQYSPDNFMISPLKMRLGYLPSDPLWQLTANKMPMSTFIEGDSAIVAFNNANSRILNRNATLNNLGDFTEEQQRIDAGDRAHDFNTHNYLSLADKEQLTAIELIDPYTSGHLAFNASAIPTFNNAIGKLNLSLKYIDTQKAKLPAYYAHVKSMNNSKSRLAKERIRNIRQGVNAQTSDFKRRLSPAKSKVSYFKKQIDKNNKLLKDLSTGNIDNVETIKHQRKQSDPMLTAIIDNIDAKQQRIQDCSNQIDNLLAVINGHYTIVDNTLEAYQDQLNSCNKIFYKEIETRAHFYDSYDDNIAHLVGLYDTAWNNDLASHNSKYFNAYDSCSAKFLDVERLYKEELRLHKSILRDYKQYKRLNDQLPNFDKVYLQAAHQYRNSLKSFNTTLENFNNFYGIYVSAADNIIDQYKKVDEPIKLFEKIEDKRNEMTEKAFNEDKSYYERVLERRIRMNKNLIARLEKLLAENK